MTIDRDVRGLRIGYLVQQFPPEVGAGPARVVEMARHWRANGAEVTVVTGFPSRVLPGRTFGEGDPGYRRKLVAEERFEGMRVLRSWLYRAKRSGFVPTIVNNATFMVSSALHALTRLGPIDVLIASAPPLFPHVSGAVLAWCRGIPLVLEVRDLWPDYLVDMGMVSRASVPGRALFALERRLLGRADAVVVVTESFRARMAGKGVEPDRVFMVPNGVDLEFYCRATAPAPLPALIRRTPSEFLVGYVGNFGAGQGLEVMADVARLLAAEDPAIRLVLVGDGPEREIVAARVAEAGLPNVSVHGSIPKQDTPAFYNACDACLVPLAPIPVFQETIPSKIFEVMACERPVIGCMEGEGRRIVESSGGGLVAAPGNARAIADATLAMRRRTAAERAEMGVRGRAYVQRWYERQVLAERYLRILARVARPERHDPRAGRG